MCRKINFNIEEVKKIVTQSTIPMAIMDSEFHMMYYNTSFVCEMDLDIRLDFQLERKSLIKLYASQETHKDIIVKYRPGAANSYLIHIIWLKCTRSGQYYCAAIAEKDPVILEKHRNELELIFHNINMINKLTDAHLKHLESLKHITAENIDKLPWMIERAQRAC